MKRLSSSLVAVLAASIYTHQAPAATIELNGHVAAATPTWSFNFAHSGAGQLNWSWDDGLSPLQMLLNQTQIQNVLRQFGSHVQDPLLQNVITELENSNFQLTQQVQDDFQNWLQSHPFTDGSQFHDWLDQFGNGLCDFGQPKGDCGGSSTGQDDGDHWSDDDHDCNVHVPTAVPEPSSILLLGLGGLGAIGLARRRVSC